MSYIDLKFFSDGATAACDGRSPNYQDHPDVREHGDFGLFCRECHATWLVPTYSMPLRTASTNQTSWSVPELCPVQIATALGYPEGYTVDVGSAVAKIVSLQADLDHAQREQGSLRTQLDDLQHQLDDDDRDESGHKMRPLQYPEGTFD